MTIKLYTDICVGPYTSSLTVDTGAPAKERGKKGLALQEGGPIHPVSFTGIILSKSLELFPCMQAAGLDGGGEQ